MIKRAKQLIELINKYDEAYFSQNTSLITDEEYDELWFELKDLLSHQEVQKELKKVDMPLGVQKSHLDKVKHLVSVLSLDKLKMGDTNFQKHLNKFSDKYDTGQGYIVESKLDGLTIVMYRTKEGPVFVTRGGNQKGENVTEQFKCVPSIWDAAMKANTGDVIRGEAIISKENFKQFANDFENARNLASASVRTKETLTAKERCVDFVAYDLMSRNDLNEEQCLRALKDLGFATCMYQKINSLDDFKQNVNVDDWRQNEKYEIDGLVIKPLIKKDFGVNGHHAKGQIALKYPPATAKTQMIAVEWQKGNGGLLSPVAIFKPVKIGGATISRASLGSYPTIKKLGLYDNSEIIVSRENDVIPQVKEVLTQCGQEIDLPENSELIGAKVYSLDNETDLATRLAKYSQSVSIDSAKMKTWQKVIDAGLISKISDIYLLTNEEEIASIKGLSKVTSQKIINEVRLSKQASFDKVLEGLQIMYLGKQSVAAIVKVFPSWEDLKLHYNDKSHLVEGLNLHATKALSELATKNSIHYLELEELKNMGVNL